MTPVLEVAGVRKVFGDAVVLRSVDLTVEAHRVAVLIGASGSGKSTLLRCVNLLETVDDGVIRLDGRTVGDGRPGPVTGRIAEAYRAHARAEGTPVIA